MRHLVTRAPPGVMCRLDECIASARTLWLNRHNLTARRQCCARYIQANKGRRVSVWGDHTMLSWILNHLWVQLLTNPTCKELHGDLHQCCLQGTNGPEKMSSKQGAANCRRAQNKHIWVAAARSHFIGQFWIRRCRSPACSCHAAQLALQ